jgi:hypothetical protein
MGDRNSDVDTWFERRTTRSRTSSKRCGTWSLANDERVSEEIKWQAPTFA